jgi:hypothetical protein
LRFDARLHSASNGYDGDITIITWSWAYISTRFCRDASWNWKSTVPIPGY